MAAVRAAASAAAAAAPAAPLPSSASPALSFQVTAVCGRARAARLALPHGVAETPMFMPVGTLGSVKGLAPRQLEDLGCQVILGNTYHLEERPGSALVAELGGLHAFTGWRRGMLTDSGGFQMVSLLHLSRVTEAGVEFASPTTGERMLLTPERSMEIQNALGADIIMQLDDVVPSTAGDPRRFEEATHRTTRWLDRCIAAHARPAEQSLFAIVQGGLDARLRATSLEGLLARGCPGYAIGGLAGGEDKRAFVRVVAEAAAALPAGKPRYVMGIGHPMDVVLCSALGADMYDSVYPTRTARFGVALAPGGPLRLKNAAFARDGAPIEPGCDCPACSRGLSRAYLHALVGRAAAPAATALVTAHNVRYMQRLAAGLRAAIAAGALPEFVRGFVAAHHPDGSAPEWVRLACALAGIELE